MSNLSVVSDLKLVTEIRGGQLFWTEGKSRSKNNGLVGSLNSDGYIVFTFNKCQYRLHRVLYCMYHGLELHQIDGKLIDHKDGNRANNSEPNLRLATHSVNNSNTESHRNGKLSGASYCNTRRRWRSRYKSNGKYIHLGWFQSEIEAHLAYVNATS